MNQNHNSKASKASTKTHGAALRARQRAHDDAHRVAGRYAKATSTQLERPNAASVIAADQLKLTFLGGLEEVGEKNMAIIEHQNEAIILDCGNNLGIDLPGVNYEINDTDYLETIKHKIKAYVITHGHLDHMGGLRHIVPKYPAPIYGSRYTIGVIQKTFDDEKAEQGSNFEPDLITVNIDNHERLKIGSFFVEFVRVTHAIPDPAAVCIDTPVGRIIATGDFRLDPEPLDNLPVDKLRLKQLGDEGVLLLLSDSSYADAEGRTPTEHTLQKSFHDVITRATGRIFVAVFSSNMNRTQMIINAAVASGRKVALDGRSMLAYAEIAVRQGILKVPKGTIVPMQRAASAPPNQLLVMCTGGQGEPNAALQRMSEGEHKYVNLGEGDTVIISSTPIPGNEVSYDAISDRLKKKGVHLFRHPTHELDGCGPLHVSGHAKRDELREMIQLIRPQFFVPVHAGHLRRYYHAELAIEEGIPRRHVLTPENGDSLYLTPTTAQTGENAPHGSLLVDQTGSVVSRIVVKDRIILSQEGILTIVLTISQKTNDLLTGPDIISRGFIAMKDNEELMQSFRAELRRVVRQRFTRIGSERFKAELRDHVAHFMYEHTRRVPIVIPVVNIIGNKKVARTAHADRQTSSKPTTTQEQERFAGMRARLLGQARRS